MTKVEPGRSSRPGWTRTRAAGLGLGRGAALAVPPRVGAQTSPSNPASPPLAAMPAMPQQIFSPLVKRVSPAVVNISVTEQPGSEEASAQLPEGSRGSPLDDFMRRFFEERRGEGGASPFGGNAHEESESKRIALGSGFIIDSSGTIVTNNHVVGEAAKVEVTLQDNSKYTAQIVGRDPRTDLAVLKIKAGKDLPYVSFGDSSAATGGDSVGSAGKPFTLGGSWSPGIVSVPAR